MARLLDGHTHLARHDTLGTGAPGLVVFGYLMPRTGRLTARKLGRPRMATLYGNGVALQRGGPARDATPIFPRASG